MKGWKASSAFCRGSTGLQSATRGRRIRRGTPRAGTSEPAARAIQRKLHQTIKRVSDDFQGRWHFNTCIAAIMELVNELYAVSVGAGDSPAAVVPVPLLREVQRTLALLLAPFAPYLAHELWEMLGEKGSLLRAPVAEVRSRPGQRR